MTGTRSERDGFGTIAVPDEHLWGAQTQRSLKFFAISSERLPPELIVALAEVKRACAQVNASLGLLAPEKAQAIAEAAEEVMGGALAGEFRWLETKDIAG